MKRKRLNRHLFLTVFLLTTLIFIIGLILGSMLTEKKMSLLIDSYEDMRLNTMVVDIQNLILQENPCQASSSSFLNDELIEFSSKLALMEETLGWDDPQVLSMKEYFSLLEIRHWFLVKKASLDCNLDRHTILFFYSNKGDCSSCGAQGSILTSLRRNNENLSVYYFDLNVDNPALNTIKELYNITSAPTLVINDKVYSGFISKGVVEDLVN